MKILFIAPLPQPITGHSLASQVLLDSMIHNNCDIKIINLSKKKGDTFLTRILSILKFYINIYKHNKSVDLIYFTISESILGNLKDILIYVICFNSLNKMTIHLHGGSFKKDILDKNFILRFINVKFIQKVNNVIILGNSHFNIFSDFIPHDKIQIVPNFSQDYLELNSNLIEKKFRSMKCINILFLTNLLPLKGYKNLLRFYQNLNGDVKKNVEIHFAGRFDSEHLKNEFLDEIKYDNKLVYHGIVEDDKKRELLHNAHILCLPTEYSEGQPICILEAYATGCIVLTTVKGGIIDIFKDNINGFEIETPTELGISKAFIKFCQQKDRLIEIGLNNHNDYLNKFRVSKFQGLLKAILKY